MHRQTCELLHVSDKQENLNLAAYFQFQLFLLLEANKYYV